MGLWDFVLYFFQPSVTESTSENSQSVFVTNILGSPFGWFYIHNGSHARTLNPKYKKRAAQLAPTKPKPKIAIFWGSALMGTCSDIAEKHYRGAILIAPSRRITSPLSIWFSTMCATRFAYSDALPKRLGNGTCAPSAS